jgi:hypothetical protein
MAAQDDLLSSDVERQGLIKHSLRDVENSQQLSYCA